MESLKSVLFTIIGLGIVFLVGYWGFSSIESGSDHVKNQQIKELGDKNQELEKEITSLKSEISLLTSEKEQLTQEQTLITEEATEAASSSTLKYQELIDDLQTLVDKGVFLKRKSQGPSVGTIQRFLNIYNNTSKRIDNDFGAGTETTVKSFQKAQGLTADGEIGPSTFRKMIDWLKKK